MRRPALPRVLVPLRHRDFRLLLGGQTISNFGNYFFYIALPFQLLAIGASALELGIAVTILSASTLVFLLLGGAVADRVPRRWLILASDGIGGMVCSLIAILAWTGELRVEHVYVASAILGAIFAFLFPAYSAIIAELIPPDLLTEANAARSLGGSLARTAGPLAAGVVIAFSGTPMAFAIDAGTFFFSFLLFVVAGSVPRTAAPSVPLLRQVREGIAFVLSTPWLWMALLAFAFLNLTYGGQRGVMTPLFVRDALHEDAATFGVVITAYGVGQIAGGIVVAQLAIRRPGIAMYVFEAVAGLATAAIGLIVWLPATLIAMMVMGIALSSSDALFNAAVQRNVPQHVLGRVWSINLLVGHLFVPLAPIAAGVLVELVGPAQTFLAAGVFAAGLAVVLLVVSPVRALR